MKATHNNLYSIALAVLILLSSLNLVYASGGEEDKKNKQNSGEQGWSAAEKQVMNMLQIEAISFEKLAIKTLSIEEELMNMLQIEALLFDEIPLSRVSQASVEQKLLEMLKIENIGLEPNNKISEMDRMLKAMLNIDQQISFEKAIEKPTYKPLYQESSLFDIE